MKRSIPALLGLLGALAAPAPAADPITVGETLKLTSKVLGEERTILVSTPGPYARSSERYPVLYVTDGDAHLVHTRGTVDFLARNGRMPDLIVVGVTNTDRTRDLSPTRATRARPDGTREDIPSSGGAGKFLDFFEKELIPFVEGRYRTVPYRILAGHSLGGLFALTALSQRPGLFDAYIAASPALGWDDDFIVRQTATFLEGKKELRKTLFVTMADEEADTPPPTRMERLLGILGATKATGFRWGGQVMPEEDHGSVVLPTHYWGLRKVFEGWRLPVDPKTRQFAGGVAELKQHYAALSERFGVTVLPPELLVNQVGYQHLLAKDVEGAVDVFRYNAGLFPQSANVHDSLGEALEQAGKKEEALACYEKAVANAKKLGDARLPVYEKNRDRLAAAPKK